MGFFMYICLCAAVTDQEIVEAVKSNKTVEDVMDELGAGSACCLCVPDITKIVIEHLDSNDK